MHNKWVDVLFVILVIALLTAYLLVPQRVAQFDAAVNGWRQLMAGILQFGG